MKQMTCYRPCSADNATGPGRVRSWQVPLESNRARGQLDSSLEVDGWVALAPHGPIRNATDNAAIESER